MIRRTVKDVFRLYRRSWWRLAVVELVMGLLLAAVAYVLLLLSGSVVQGLGSVLVSHGQMNLGPVLVFGLCVVLVFLVTCLPLVLAALAAISRITDEQLAGRRPSTFGAMAQGLRAALRSTGGVLLALVVLVLLFVLAPVLTALGLLGLLLTLVVRAVRRRRPGFAAWWPSVRTLVWAAIPFGFAARWLARALVVLPMIALGSAGPVAALRGSGAIVRGRRLLTVLAALAAVLVIAVLQVGATALGSLAGDLGVTLAQAIVQVVLLALPTVVLTVVYRLSVAASGGSGLPSSPTAPYAVGVPPRRRVSAGALSPVWIRRVAILMPAVLVFVGLAVVPVAAGAASPTSATFTVTSAADNTDAGTLAQQQADCAAASGDCTLRAALAQAAALSEGGTVTAITIGFSGDVTVPVTAGSPLAFNNFGGEGTPAHGTLTIDGLGHAVTVDGQNASQGMSLFSHSWDFVVKGVEFRNGNASAGQGGGLSVGDGRTVLIDSVTFDHNTAIGGGGLYAGANVLVQNSTFSENSLATPDGNSVPGGADIFGAGAVRAVNDTFAGSSGGAIYNWSSVGHTFSLDNSLVVIDALAAHGAFDCSGGGFTGTANVAAYGDVSCPGVTTSATAFLAPLARATPGAPPVLALSPDYTEALGAGGIGAGAVACPGVDERGRVRPAAGCDVGAYQFDPASTITVASNANPAVLGDTVTFTAHVRPAEEPGTIATGTVQFTIDGLPAGAPVAVQPDGTASYAIDSLTAGAHGVAASYTPAAGDRYTASSTASALTETVSSSGSAVTIVSDAPTAAAGDTVTFTITVGPSSQAITGTVTITDITGGLPGTVVAAAVPLASDGTATVSTSSLPVGPRTLVAAYSGDGNNAPGQSAHFTQDIRVASTVELRSDLSSAVYGAPVTFTATVPTTAGSVPTGTVVFAYGQDGALTREVALVDGAATLVLSDLDAGSDEVTAHYGGDQVYEDSVSAAAQVAIDPATTRTVLSTDPADSAAYGAPVTISALVQNLALGSTADPVGTVTFGRGATTLGTATLTGNGDGTATATYTTTVGQLPVGADSIAAAYDPAFITAFGHNFGASDTTGSITVEPADTAVEVGSDANPGAFGQLVALTATVAAQGGSTAVPDGTVTFTEGGATLGSATLSNGVATLGVATLALGDHDIRAAYAANDRFAASSALFTEQIGSAETTTTLTADPASGAYRAPVTVAVTVAGDRGGSPDGVVTLLDGAQSVATILVTAGAGSATLTTLHAGAHHLVASFAAGGGYLASSGAADYAVTAAGTSTALLLSPATPAFGDTVTLTATVGGAVTPEGQVEFLQDGATVLATVPLIAVDGTTATASFDTSSLPQTSAYPRGQSSITARFVPAGSGDFAGSEDTQPVTVQQGTTQIALAVTPGTVGATVTATATISTTRGHGTPTGTVQFSYGDSSGIEVPVVDGQAVLTGIVLPVGDHVVTAVYTSGDQNFLAGIPDGSDRIGVHVIIGQGTPTVVLSGTAAGTIDYGTNDTLTATVSGAGDTPTGAVTFTAVGPQGSTVLGTVPLTAVLPLLFAQGTGAAKATLATTAIPVGTQRITAAYGGNLSYSMVSSAELEQTVVAASTTTTVTTPLEPTLVGAPVTFTATVVSSSGAVPAGSMQFSIGGVPLASTALDGAGTASVSTTPTAAGSAEITATFTPADGDFTGSFDVLDHDVILVPTDVELTADLGAVGVDQPITFTIVVGPSIGSHSPTGGRPSGVIDLSDGEGNTCSTGVMAGPDAGEVTGSCAIAWSTVGSRTVTATYSGDTQFAAGTVQYHVAVRDQAPTIDFVASSDRAWVGGETTTLYWTVAGPSSDDAPITITRGASIVCTSTARIGSCDYTFPAAASGPVTFGLQYAGDDGWTDKTVTLTQHLTACSPFVAPTASPAAGGTVAVQSTPDCDGGTGFLDGDAVTFAATPNPGYSMNAWLFGTAAGTSSTVIAGYPGSVTNTAFFSLGCVTVTVTNSDLDAFDGSVRSSRDPDCGPDAGDWTWTGSGWRGGFRPNTTLTLTATAPVGAPQQAFYRWTGLGSAADPLAATAVLDLMPGQEDLRITAIFGALCYHSVSFPAPAGGTAQLGAPNCTDPRGSGYAAGSIVPVSTHAIGTAYFTGWTQFGQVTTSAESATGSTGTVRITGDNLVVGASYGQCVQFSVASVGTLNDGTPLGSAGVGLAGNCPSQGDGWYKVGSTTTVTATPTRGHTFGGWSGLPLLGPPSEATSTTATVQLWTSGVETATFYSALQCRPFTVLSKPAGALTVSATFPGGTGTCPAGEYDQSIGGGHNDSVPVVLSATANAGAPGIGWSGSTGLLDKNSITQPVTLKGVPGASLNFSVFGDSTFTAWACEGLDAQLTLISPDGTRHTTPVPANTDFIDAAPAPNCAWGASSYVIGQSVFPQANGAGPGYTFVGWSGAITSDSEYPTTPMALDGTAATTAPLVATYQVQCYALTSNFDNVDVSPAPNCPDTPASAHEYIGGTTVILQQTGDGSLVFRGWTGSPDGTDGNYAISQMTADATIYADYTSKSVSEHFSDAINTIGDGIAVTAKKLVGVASAVVAGIILGGNPLTAVGGLAVLLGKAVQGMADLLGVSSDGLVAFENGIDDIQSMMSFIVSPLQCATQWSASPANGPPDTGSTGEGQLGETLAKYKLAQDKANQLAAARLAQQEASSALGEARVLAGRLGVVGAVGAGIYSTFGSDGGDWSGSAADNWSSGGDQYMTCYGQSIPSYFGLPPVPDTADQ